MVVELLDDGRGLIFNGLDFDKNLIEEDVKTGQTLLKPSQSFTSGLHYDLLGHRVIIGGLALLV